MDKNKSRHRYKTGITTEDKQKLAEIIKNDLISNGLPPEEIPINSAVGREISAWSTLFDKVSVDFTITARESSLPHAQRSTSIMNQLIQHTDEISLAEPSQIELFVRIPLLDVVMYGEKIQANTWQIEYTDKNIVRIDDLPFMPADPIHYVRVSKLPSGEHLAKVYKEEFGTMKEVLVQTIFTQDMYMLGFKVKFLQLEIETEPLAFTDDQLERFVVTSDYPIHKIEVFYRDNAGTDWRQIQTRLYFTRGNGEFLEYRPVAINAYQIDHKYVQGGFKPIVGGQLQVLKYVTHGRNVKVINNPDAAIPETPDLAVTHISYEPVGVDYYESYGAKLANTDIEYMRNYTIKLKGSRRRIDTESDLKTFMKNYPGESVFEPRLTRNDIKSRIFSCYSILSFRSDYGTSKRIFTVPTNSGNLTVDPKTIASKSFKGFTYYTFNSRYAIKSTQTRQLDFFTIDPSFNPMGNTPAPDGALVNLDPSNPASNSYVFYYVTPFIVSFSPHNSMARVYADAQFDTPYLTFSSFDNINLDVPVRFINTSIRMNDFLDYADATNTTTKEIFQLNAQIRCESKSGYEPILGETFKAILRFKDINNKEKVMTAKGIMLEDNDIYDVVFPLKSDRKIYDRTTTITYYNEAGVEETSDVDVFSEYTLELSYIEPQQTDPQSPSVILKPATTVLVNKYKSNIELFKEVSSTCYLQTNVTKDGLFRFLSLPMIKQSFYKLPRNRKNIVEEINGIIKFMRKEVFDDLDEYAKVGMDVGERLENNFMISIKFAKTYGLSKFLDIGNVNTVRVPINNLQVKPTIQYRLLDDDFDLSSIASELNQTLINHDYFQDDYHLNGIVYDTLYNAGSDVRFLEVVNLDKYPPNHLKLMRNTNKANNWDPPEVLSISPEYDPVADNYFFDVKFIQI